VVALEVSKIEATLILAALRNWQAELQTVDMYDIYEAYFEDADTPDHEAIDDLCRRITEASFAARD
jgi:hypothetical protein